MWPLSTATTTTTTTTTATKTSPSSSSSSSVAVPHTPKRKSIEEVWQDITFSHDNQPLFGGVMLQDFLAGSFKASQPSAAAYKQLPQLPLLPLLPTALCLNTAPPGCPKIILDDAPPASDRHHKRMMKNRESAARSRARKQAYTNDLELEVSRLGDENSTLKSENEELRIAMAAQIPKKCVLQRKSSAPF